MPGNNSAEEPRDGGPEADRSDWRIDWRNIDDERRARQTAGGASRDIAGELLAGGY